MKVVWKQDWMCQLAAMTNLPGKWEGGGGGGGGREDIF